MQRQRSVRSKLAAAIADPGDGKIVVDIACGGGGFMGAYNGEAAITLLKDPDVRFNEFTGTSAGAVIGGIIKSARSPQEAEDNHDIFFHRMDGMSQTVQLVQAFNPMSYAPRGVQSYLMRSYARVAESMRMGPKDHFREVLHGVINEERLQDPSGMIFACNTSTKIDPTKGLVAGNVREHIFRGADVSIDAIIGSGSLYDLGATHGHYDGAYASNPPLPSAAATRPLVIITCCPYVSPGAPAIPSQRDPFLKYGAVHTAAHKLITDDNRPVYVIALQGQWRESTRVDPRTGEVAKLRELGRTDALACLEDIKADFAAGYHAQYAEKAFEAA